MPFSIANITTSTVQCYVQYHSRLSPPPLIPPSRDKRRHLIWRAISGFSENRNEKEEAKKRGEIREIPRLVFMCLETEAVVSFVKPHNIANPYVRRKQKKTEVEIEVSFRQMHCNCIEVQCD